MKSDNEPRRSAASSQEPGKDPSVPLPADSTVPEAEGGGAPAVGLASVAHPYRLGLAVTLGGLTALGFAFVLGRITTVLVYIALALLIALGLDPLVRWLQRRGVKRPLGIALVYATFFLLVALLVLLIGPVVIRQVTSFVQSIPELIVQLQDTAGYAWVTSNFGDQVAQALNSVLDFVGDPQNILALTGGVLQVGVGIGNVLSGALIVLVLSLYFLASLESGKYWVLRLVPAYGRRRTRSLIDQISRSVGNYLGGVVLLALINSTVVGLLSLVLGLAFPPLMALTAFSVALIPLVGSVLFWIIGIVVALFQSTTAAIIFALAYFVYMQVEAYVLAPRIMSRSVAVPGVLLVVGALVGGTLLGLLGAVLAVPITASVILVIKQVLIPRQDAKTRAP